MLSDTSSPHHSMSVIASARTVLSTMMLEQNVSSNERESLGGMDSRARIPGATKRNELKRDHMRMRMTNHKN